MRYNYSVPKIKQLSEELIPKIAAGEVVERPASVVKELVENALDAGATHIFIELENGGLKKIKVTDDGCGMDTRDVQVCFLPHTTSKLFELDDLLQLKTLGFRGEALASICAVSRTTIKSRSQEADIGFEVSVEYGLLVNSQKCGMKIGTSVGVDDLFGNIPVRKKFLKSVETESRKVLDVIVSYALAYPQVKFVFSRDGKLLLNLVDDDDLFSRVYKVLGNDLFVNLLPFEQTLDRFGLVGFISKPQAGSYTKDLQYLFVNGRAVANSLVAKAVKDAYGKLLEHRVFPPFVLYVTIQPDLVDVNIHPRKEEIAFWDDAFVYETLVKFFKTFLATQDLTYIKNTGDETKDAYDFKELKKASKFPFMTLKDSVDTWSLKNLADSNDSSQILQIANTYLAVPIKDGLLLIDQHAAHESILYEDYLKAFQAKVLSQSPVELDEPVIVNLSIVDAAVLVDCMKDLELLGFSIHPFGQNSFRISAVPELFKTHNLAKLLQELLAEMTASHNGKLTDIDEKSQKTLAFLACRGAIKAGEKLSPDEKMHLVEKLANSKELYTCPHGRPVKIILTNRELAHMFKRV